MLRVLQRAQGVRCFGFRVHGQIRLLSGTLSKIRRCPAKLSACGGVPHFPCAHCLGAAKQIHNLLTIIQTPRMNTQQDEWREIAQAKLNAINDSIPQPWRLSEVPSITERRDVTELIRRYLSTAELEITEKDASGIINYTSNGQWKAADVTNAFCHRASLAHQLVSPSFTSYDAFV